MTAVPRQLQPPSLGLVLTDFPELQAVVAYAGGTVEETNIAITWQVATNPTFTQDLHSVTSAVRYSSGQVARQPIDSRLHAANWFLRAKATDINGVESAWSPFNSFQIDHRPFVSNMSPAHGAKVHYGDGNVRFAWEFSDGDPSDRQTAYQVQARHASNDAILFDTGKVTSAVAEWVQVIAPVNSTGFYYWQARVWDTYDIDSPWTDPILFQLGVNPVSVILEPPNSGVVVVPNPTIQWLFASSNAPQSTYAKVSTDYATYTALSGANPTYSNVLAGSLAQAGQTHYRVTVTSGAVDNPSIYDSGWLAGIANTHEIPAVVHLGHVYEVIVSVRDTTGFEGSSTPVRFTSQWPAPTSPLDVIVDVSAVDDPAVGAVQITWNAVSRDPTFSHWRVYRRIQGTSAWERVGLPVYEKVDVPPGPRAEVLDYLFESGRTYEYAVSQVAYRYFNEESESILEIRAATPESTKYWLIHGTDPTFNLALSHVVSDSFSEEYEQFDDNIIGRGRRREVGTRWGYIGSLTCHLRDFDERGSSLELVEILEFKAGRVDAFLRVPFGHIWRVALGDITVDRMAGVGRREFCDVTIPYTEVFSPVEEPIYSASTL
jgi:hypothetical protein